MKKSLLFIWVIVFLNLFLFSCKEEYEINEDNIELNTPLSITIEGNQSKFRTNGYTDKEHLYDGDELGLFVYQDKTLQTIYNTAGNYLNIKSVNNNGEWYQSNPIYLGLNPGYVFAYFPYREGYDFPDKIPVEHVSQTDYLYGTHSEHQEPVHNKNSNVDLTLKHALTCLEFKVYKTGYLNTGKITRIEIEGINPDDKLLSHGTLHIGYGTLMVMLGKEQNPFIENNDSGIIPYLSESSPTDKNMIPRLLVLPQLYDKSKYRLKFTIDGNIYYCNMGNHDWEVGKKIQYNIQLKGNSLYLSTIEIAPWVGGNGTSARLIEG